MFGILALILFVISWFEHGAGSANVPAWFDWQGTAVVGLALMAAHLVWPVGPWRRP